MIHNPNILILDEPTAGLDINTRYDLWSFIKEIKKQGISIILTTHYIEEAEKLCDTIAILSKGRLLKLEDKNKLIDDLSENVITIFFDKEVKLPKQISKLNFNYKDKKLDIYVSKKEQHIMLKKILAILEKNKLQIHNFSIHHDTLENIFRRIVNEN